MTLANKQRILQLIYGVSEKCLLAPETPFSLDNLNVVTAIFCMHLYSNI